MKKHIHVNECDSTQDILKEQLSLNKGLMQFLVSCENQIHGRGRGENSWTSLPGSLCFSFNLRPHPVVSFTALEISVLITRFFESKGRNLRLKWPNDIWNEAGKKCGGILVQGSHNTYIAGVGLNLFSDENQFGGVFDSNFKIDKREWSREIADFVLHHRYKEVDTLQDDWLTRCGHLKSEVTIHEGNQVFEGRFEGLGPHGECLLNQEGKILHLYNGSLRIKQY